MEDQLTGGRKALLFLLPAAVALALDQLTKSLVRAQLPLAQPLPVVPGFFNLTHVTNKGGAWSVLHGHVSLLALFSALVAVGIAVYVWRDPSLDRWRVLALGILLGGTLGNLADRVIFGQVTDFLDVFWGVHHFPTFNVADICINLGVAWLLLGTLREKESSPR